MYTKPIGYCGVDSGQLFIIDPCYIKHTEQGNGQWNMEWDETEDGRSVKTLPDPTLENGEANFYSKVCEANKQGFAEVEMGVVVGTTHGDGNYAVQGIFGDDDELLGFFVDMDGQIDATFEYDESGEW